METSIYNKLKEIKEETISFHMPGHKYGKVYDELGYGEIMQDIYRLDTTEIIDTDDLHEADGIIKDSQEAAIKVLFPNRDDLDLTYLVNGSTCGIEASILTTCKEGDKIIMNRASHQSAFNGCILSGAVPVFVNEDIDYENNIYLGADVFDYLRVIRENPDAKAIFITRPTYYGMSFEVEEIIAEAHKHSMIVIVDEAHGAHLGLFDDFPKSAIVYGADMVVQSVHKTLPSITQTSVLITRKGAKIDRNRLKRVLTMVESSSPSYVMMMSLELAFEIYEKYGRELMAELVNNIDIFKKKVKKYKIFQTSDPTKIFINTIDKGINGYDFAKILRHEYNIQVELSNYSGILMLCTIGNKRKDFKAMLAALEDISNRKLIGVRADFFEDSGRLTKSKRNNDLMILDASKKIRLDIPRRIPKCLISPKKAFDMDTERVDLEKSEGRICGEFVVPYPPGICVLAPGEEINREVIGFLNKARTLAIDINGMESEDFKYIKVIKERD